MNYFFKKILLFVACLIIVACGESSDGEVQTSNGVGGSTAKFTIQNNHLITIEDHDIQIFSLANPSEPVLVNAYYTPSTITLETIYPYQTNRILLGTNTGAIIMDHSTPGTITEIAFPEHVTSCDPVIAKDDYMYITLRNGRSCSLVNNVNGVNQLLIYDISDITQPELRKTIELDQPYGLSIKETSLFVCYEDGVLEFDITNPLEPAQIGDFDMPCNDIIASTHPMILTGDDGIRLVQKDSTNLIELAIIRKGT